MNNEKRCECGRRHDRPGAPFCFGQLHISPTLAQIIVEKIERDICNRGGLEDSWQSIDDEILDEIRDGWAEVIDELLARPLEEAEQRGAEREREACEDRVLDLADFFHYKRDDKQGAEIIGEVALEIRNLREKETDDE